MLRIIAQFLVVQETNILSYDMTPLSDLIYIRSCF